MKWEGREESSNVEDQRGRGRTGLAIGGGAAIVIVIIGLLLGVDPRQLLQMVGGGQGNPAQQADPNAPRDPEEDKEVRFTRTILHDTEVVWEEQFKKIGKEYREPTLVFYTDSIRSGCGFAESSVGPFYCPADEKIYIDLSFYRDMDTKLDASGDFARAYVIAHEVGHHVQHLLGYSRPVDEARRSGAPQSEVNRMSVRLELQADYLAGVWAHWNQEKFDFLEKGDMESALHAANQIGDDRLQKKYQGTVRPDHFTHGTSKQRMRWFKEGFQTGKLEKARLLFDLPYDQL